MPTLPATSDEYRTASRPAIRPDQESGPCLGCVGLHEPRCAADGQPAVVWLKLEYGDAEAHDLALCRGCWDVIQECRAEHQRASASNGRAPAHTQATQPKAKRKRKGARKVAA
jgi:hypothetical protein